ncbi:MAG: CDP-2,3-bis-(O-geranylgeranyl)-sn-glycerol synthase [Candidatus Verstraetearchaeota archaeon]|jgi:CDP-2,3-bis-(O-geranylgeranyl)-sn-glycerol synthase|nr:CDP-2,3-bis-(O-geranylgeranyl)-sn-glycerol synthase [Candidatus Verstraetearchaeota archaeon]
MKMVDLFALALSSFILISPAYVANSIPVVLKGKMPIDRGKTFVDGRRIFGDGKTIEGFLSGLLCGTLLGAAFGYPLHALLLSLGALVGDLIGAFIKRRLGMPRGHPAPILDQLDFIIGALAFVSVIYPVSLEQFLFLVLVTPPIHLIANFIAYMLKLKSHPW